MQPITQTWVDVVAGDDAVRESLRLLLEFHRYEGEDYASGSDYILNSVRKPQCVVVDEELSDMQGMEFVQHLRISGDLTPLILVGGGLTPQQSSHDSELSLRLLDKPYESEKLLACIGDTCPQNTAHEEEGPYARWINEALIGVSALDREHDELAELVFDFYDAVLANEPDNELRKRLGVLVSHTDAHFLHEENYMRFAGYDSMGQHQEAHSKLKAALLRVLPHNSPSWEKRSVLALESLRFLKNWLMAHIRSDDRKLGAFLNSQGIW